MKKIVKKGFLLKIPDIFSYLKDFKCPGRMRAVLDQSQDFEDLINDLAGDEAADVDIHELHEGHGQKRYSGLKSLKLWICSLQDFYDFFYLVFHHVARI